MKHEHAMYRAQKEFLEFWFSLLFLKKKIEVLSFDLPLVYENMSIMYENYLREMKISIE
jgi:hypothetical protein